MGSDAVSVAVRLAAGANPVQAAALLKRLREPEGTPGSVGPPAHRRPCERAKGGAALLDIKSKNLNACMKKLVIRGTVVAEL